MTDEVADAIRYCFSSPNVLDSNLESANIVDVGQRIAVSIQDLTRVLAKQTPDGKAAAMLYRADEFLSGLACKLHERDETKVLVAQCFEIAGECRAVLREMDPILAAM